MEDQLLRTSGLGTFSVAVSESDVKKIQTAGFRNPV